MHLETGMLGGWTQAGSELHKLPHPITTLSTCVILDRTPTVFIFFFLIFFFLFWNNSFYYKALISHWSQLNIE